MSTGLGLDGTESVAWGLEGLKGSGVSDGGHGWRGSRECILPVRGIFQIPRLPPIIKTPQISSCPQKDKGRKKRLLQGAQSHPWSGKQDPTCGTVRPKKKN